MLNYSAHEADGVLVFTVEETDPTYEPSTQREWLYKTIESRVDPRFAIDLGEIRYMASSDLGFLITIKRRIDAHKGRVVLFGIDPFILDILRTMRLDKLFMIADDWDSALEKLGPPS